MNPAREQHMNSSSEPGAGRRRESKQPGHPRRFQNPDVRLSKALSYALRHGAATLGLQMGTDGFLYLDELLHHPQFRSYTQKDVLHVVETNSKQRFTLQPHPIDGRLQIRANQGHSIQVRDLELVPIEDGPECPTTAVHGTYLRHWPSIRARGLCRMSRTHIHLAPGLPAEHEVISGMRKDCNLAIFINLQKAISGCLLPLE
ncbi:tRNA 2'-phosphotransferase 1 isoform X2 [Rhinatrema bivittatum]|uniref:tRNA 2'-phosphotransferase 1 isoform X2 n=1 Tax=Rhinatrema bivittatum TaxID=194408 RepID=UPI00112C76FB|nr:tRNA 2'-phosphotransferase 1 isoform X2 [Rhinatrema bivittatum]